MDRQELKKWLIGLRRKWMFVYFLQVFFCAIALAFLVTLFSMYVFFTPRWVMVPSFLVVFSVLALFLPFWKLHPRDLVQYLNRNFLELEDSAELLIKNKDGLSGFEQLQLAKIATLLPGFKRLEEPRRKLQWTGFSVFCAVILLGGIILLEASPNEKKKDTVKQNLQEGVLEELPVQVRSVEVSIQPPAYTQMPKRVQKQFSLSVESGSMVKWELQFNHAPKEPRFIFNGTEAVALQSFNQEGTRWGLSRSIDSSGFYQVELAGERSDFYSIESIADLAPQLTITQPKPQTTIDFGEPKRIELKVSIRDDYGLKDGYISTTLASGKGEGVSFTEMDLPFHDAVSGKRSVNLQETIDLAALGMKPGDELYFYVKAIDQRTQASQSEMYIVTLVDTAELMSIGNMSGGVDLVPEYFRSQRQLIIDTERLIEEKGNLSKRDFSARSNALGMDQKLLRLRYGKFLGEEFETEIGGDDDHEGEHEHAEEFGNVEALMEKYAHKHDIAEDATFFEPEQKAQLKAVLTEMWSAELQLRINEPHNALPFEYKALRLLKDLQQQSRVYVAKVNATAIKLDEVKRLSGEREEVLEPRRQYSVPVDTERTTALNQVLALLNSELGTRERSTSHQAVFTEVERYLMESAKEDPVSFLPALKELRDLQQGKGELGSGKLQQAIRKMLDSEEAKPQVQGTNGKMGLQELYFKALQKHN